jgi:ABC-type uncharacterized transport system substrate-binding protein
MGVDGDPAGLRLLFYNRCRSRPSGGDSACSPHVWVKVAAEIIYDADGSIQGIRHAWTFDEMFLTYALQGIRTETGGVYTREELAPLAQTNVKSLKDADYFTFRG